MSKKQAIYEVNKLVDLDTKLDHKSLLKLRCTCKVKKWQQNLLSSNSDYSSSFLIVSKQNNVLADLGMDSK